MIKRRNALAGLGAVAATPWLAGCGGGGGDVDTRDPKLRLFNASAGYSALDLYLDDERKAVGVARGAVGSAIATDNSVGASLTDGGSATYLADETLALADKSHTALVAYGWAGALKTYQLTEDGDDPDSGRLRLRVLNLAADAGNLDVYITDEADLLQAASPAASALAPAAASGFLQYNAGTRRIRVTGAGDLQDLRMDVKGVTLAAGGVVTLVLVSGASGVLVAGHLLPQEGAATELVNTLGRVRVVASVAGNAVVTASAGGETLLSNRSSPTVGSYVRVPQGTHAIALEVNGVPVTNAGSVMVGAGADVTLLVAGTASLPEVRRIADDNRLPANSNHFAIRLLHGAQPLAAAVAELSVDLSAVITNVAYGNASARVSLAENTSADVRVDTPLSLTPAYEGSELNLAKGGVYTLFLLSAGTQPRGILRKER